MLSGGRVIGYVLVTCHVHVLCEHGLDDLASAADVCHLRFLDPDGSRHANLSPKGPTAHAAYTEGE